MKFLLTLLALFVGCAAVASAQTGASYSFDNFDFANGVKIEKPPQRTPAKRTRRSFRAKDSTDSTAATSNTVPATFTRLTNMATSRSLDGFTTGDANVDNFIVESGNRNGVDPVLLYAIMHQESTFKPRAISPKGARGLMQLMPGTAARYGVTNIFDPRQNIEGGARYMRFLLDLFDDDLDLALAGYNAGEGAVMKFGNRIPPYSETQEYVRRIGRRYSLMRDPLTAQSAFRVRRDQLASLRGKEPVPLTIYERSVYAVRLPDGRLQLVSQ
jgi:soluble lytic murein transglycosylase-like protein